MFLQSKKVMIAVLVLTGLTLCNTGAEARRAHDPAVATQTTTAQQRTEQKESQGKGKKRAKTDEKEQAAEVKKPSLAERIEAILHPPEPVRPPVVQSCSDSIEGMALASQRQCVEYLLDNNPYPDISVSPEQLVAYYYAEGGREGIRPDAAFAQAIKETGGFRYGGTVTPDQNNYCGLGTTSATVKGGYFATAELGVRAQIQHLMAYCTTRLPQMPIVDPRYWLVRDTYGDEVLTRWSDLDGRWAVPGNNYGESIMFILSQILLKP